MARGQRPPEGSSQELVEIEYQVPVLVQVNIRTRTVQSVTVVDEAVAPTLTTGRRPMQAREIAENVEWPPWDLGA